MIINEKSVEELKTEKGTQYSYFACQCEDKNKQFLDGLLESIKGREDFDQKYQMDEFVSILLSDGWYVTTMYQDQWSLVSLKNEETGDSMRIQCDIVDHGLAVAIAIAEKIEK